MFANQWKYWDCDNTEYHSSTDVKHGSSRKLQPIDEIFGKLLRCNFLEKDLTEID